MTKKQKGSWFLSVWVVLAVLISLTAFTLHYKNWFIENPKEIRVISGFYTHKVVFSALDSVVWESKIPPMERNSGFSYNNREKGSYISPDNGTLKAYVFVDNYKNRKIKLVDKDTLVTYINLRDSLATDELYNRLLTRLPNNEVPN